MASDAHFDPFHGLVVLRNTDVGLFARHLPVNYSITINAARGGANHTEHTLLNNSFAGGGDRAVASTTTNIPTSGIMGSARGCMHKACSD